MPASPLQQRIIERIRQDGPLSFAEYMRMALYEPGYGYYVSGPTHVGWEGDFYTSTDVSTFFANCMGRQLYQLWERLDRPQPFVVLEQGAGRGDLARGVQEWAEQEDPTFWTALKYQTEDIRQGLDALTSSLSPSVILSNELIDAFPVHIVEKQHDQLTEIYVAEDEGRLYEVSSTLSTQELYRYLDDYKIKWQTFPDGWRGEINLDARDWMTHAAELIFGPDPRRKRRGFILTIDYGSEARELYIPERDQGTLTCYFKHQLTDRPLVKPGEQDITAHVNFTALIATGRQQGLRLDSLTTQRQWLTKMGIHEDLERIRARDFTILETNLASNEGQTALLKWFNLRQSIQALTSSSGMGKFKVLIMKR